MSGLYLFLPHSDAKSLDVKNNTFVIIEGAVRNSILLRGPDEALVYQHIYLDLNSKALNIINRVDVRATSNFELSMRIHSSDFNSDSNEQFYTDLNGFQVFSCPPCTVLFCPALFCRSTLIHYRLDDSTKAL